MSIHVPFAARAADLHAQSWKDVSVCITAPDGLIWHTRARHAALYIHTNYSVIAAHLRGFTTPPGLTRSLARRFGDHSVTIVASLGYNHLFTLIRGDVSHSESYQWEDTDVCNHLRLCGWLRPAGEGELAWLTVLRAAAS